MHHADMSEEHREGEFTLLDFGETNTIGRLRDSSQRLPIRRAEQLRSSISEGSNSTLHLN